MASLEGLGSIRALEIIDEDPRPTFVVQLETAGKDQDTTLHPIYCNAAMQLPPDLLNLAFGNHSSTEGSNFARWVLDPDPSEAAFLFHRLHWTYYTLRDRWKVLSGTSLSGCLATEVSPIEDLPSRRSNGVKLSVENGQSQDGAGRFRGSGYPAWTDVLPRTPHMELFRLTDWSATPLGPLHSWSSRLRHTTELLLCDSRPGCLFWGSQKVIIYNQAYSPIAGREKPLGSVFKDVWASEIVEALDSAFETSTSNGYATTMEDAPFFIDRHGYLEETYFSWSMIPIYGNNRVIEGFWNTALETTRKKLAERRIQTLISVVCPVNRCSFWHEVLKGFESNDLDIPFVLAYSLEKPKGHLEENQSQSTSDFQFESALGLDNGSTSQRREDKNIGTRFLPLVQAAHSQSQCVYILSTKDGTLPRALFQGLRWRGFAEEPHSVVVITLKASQSKYYFLLGLNPRKAYDSDYEQFTELLNRQLATLITSANMMNQARIDHAKLSRQLVEGEARFKIMTETNPAGMFYLSPLGEVIYANDTWYEMTGHARKHKSEMSFMDFILDDDKEMLIEEWHKITVLRQKRTFEVRIKRKTPKGRNAWMLASGMPEESEDGSLKSVMGFIADISLQKVWIAPDKAPFEAQEDALERATFSEQITALTERHRVEAEKARKSQESFMDVTSHEMRNPLSAILQSADGIVSSMLELETSNTQILSSAIAQSTLEAAQTIVLCAQHQAHIINDVLTLSKLDSAMVQITPVVVQPDAVVHATLNMFSRELASLDIGLEFSRDESYLGWEIDWVTLDPSRLTQVFINLMTNAIKFTKMQPKRKISVTLGASIESPPYEKCVEIEWFPSRAEKPNNDVTVGSEWGTGQSVFIYVSVNDTGRGVSNDEKTRLFHRFAQANVRTHIEYGGSGLGLFISRELTELQGGEIGLRSEPGKGSTFAFFVNGRRASEPTKASKHQSEDLSEKLEITTLNVNDAESQPTAGQKRQRAQKYAILLVEDNLVNQRVLDKQLTKAGHSVTLANHGREALEHLKATKVWKGNEDAKDLDVVLMDLEMPVMDGLTATHHIRGLEANGDVQCHVPIIAVTANARKEQIETCLQAGMDDVMPKPFRVAELTEKMDKLLSRS